MQQDEGMGFPKASPQGEGSQGAYAAPGLTRLPWMLSMAVALWICNLGSAGDGLPTLEDLFAIAEKHYSELSAGRIHYHEERASLLDGKLAEMVADRKALFEEARGKALQELEGTSEGVRAQMAEDMGGRLERASMYATVAYYREFVDDDVELVFDQAKDACRVERRTRRNVAGLIEANDLGDFGRMNMVEAYTDVRTGDTMLRLRKTQSGDRAYTLMERNASLREEAFLTDGLLLRRNFGNVARYHHSFARQGDVLVLTVDLTRPTFGLGVRKRRILVLDPALDFRVREDCITVRANTTSRRTYSYQKTNGVLYVRSMSTVLYDPDSGEPTDWHTRDVSHCEFTESLDASVFSVSVPTTVPLIDQLTMRVVKREVSPLGGDQQDARALTPEKLMDVILEDAVQELRIQNAAQGRREGAGEAQ